MQSSLRFPHDERRRGGVPDVQQGRRDQRHQEGRRELGGGEARGPDRDLSAGVRRVEQPGQVLDETVDEVSALLCLPKDYVAHGVTTLMFKLKIEQHLKHVQVANKYGHIFTLPPERENVRYSTTFIF